MTRVLIADDHQLLRQALRRALEDAGFEVVAEAGDGEEAIRLAEGVRPDVVVMDITMPVLDGIEATRVIVGAHPETRILVLTMHGEPAVIAQAVDAGAVAFLTKDASMQEVVRTVTQVASGEVMLSAELAESMLGELRTDEATIESPLTPREEEILQLIADGLSTTEVAKRLFISLKTVKNHLASTYDKLDARDRTQAVLSGVRIGIVQLR